MSLIPGHSPASCFLLYFKWGILILKQIKWIVNTRIDEEKHPNQKWSEHGQYNNLNTAIHILLFRIDPPMGRMRNGPPADPVGSCGPIRSGGQLCGFFRITRQKTEESGVLDPGVYSPGAMRQWGRHAVAFVGERDFDDPFYMDNMFKHTNSK